MAHIWGVFFISIAYSFQSALSGEVLLKDYFVYVLFLNLLGLFYLFSCLNSLFPFAHIQHVHSKIPLDRGISSAVGMAPRATMAKENQEMVQIAVMPVVGALLALGPCATQSTVMAISVAAPGEIPQTAASKIAKACEHVVST